MRDEDILAELGFGPAELEHKAQQTEVNQIARWGTSGIEIMNVPIQTPPFEPLDPEELERTRRELWIETIRHDGDARVATKFLGPLDDAGAKVHVQQRLASERAIAATRRPLRRRKRRVAR